MNVVRKDNMTNSLIPYSFTPGTKAKAQEVNANFIALADGIDSTKQYTIDEIDRVEEKYDTKFDDVTPTLANNDLSNTNFLTNCVLKAPNGISSVSGRVITVKSGLKCLIPNGKTEDGTLKNIELTLDENITHTLPTNESSIYFFLRTDKKIICWGGAYMESPTQPTLATPTIWFDTTNNQMKMSDSSGKNFTNVNLIYLGYLIGSVGTGAINVNNPLPVTRLITHSDLESGHKYRTVVRSFSSGLSWYRQWSDGWLEQGGWATGSQTITLFKAYNNTNFNIMLTTAQDGTNANYYNLAANNKTVSSFYVFTIGHGTEFYWRTTGPSSY